jgi:hypothetical protein
MAAIHITDRRTAVRFSAESRALARAASVAGSAPSLVSGGRTWRWRIDGPALSLYSEPAYHQEDENARLLVVNCGIALHYARTALAAYGAGAEVRYVPDPADDDLLATITYAGPVEPVSRDVRLYRAIAARRTDSRAVAPDGLADAAVDRLVAAAHRPGVRLRTLDDAGRVLSVHPEGDDPPVLLAAGEATSAILLNANVDGLATDLGRGRGGAVTAVRIGVPVPHRPAPV